MPSKEVDHYSLNINISVVDHLNSLMEFPKPTRRLICQEDLELSLAALHPVHQEARQLRGVG